MERQAPEIRSYENRGFQLTFGNGWTVSVMFGPGTYSSNRAAPRSNWRTDSHEYKSQTADVSIWDPKGETIKLSAELSHGWSSSDMVAKLIGFTQSLPETVKAEDFGAGPWRGKLVNILHPEGPRD